MKKFLTIATLTILIILVIGCATPKKTIINYMPEKSYYPAKLMNKSGEEFEMRLPIGDI